MSLPDLIEEAIELSPDSIPELETVGLIDALALAIKALEKEAEVYLIAAKMVAGMAEVAPPEAKKDAARRRRLLSAIETIRQHKAAIKPY